MGKKKLFKRLLAVVMALVLSNVVTTVERAEAATCEHVEHYSQLVYSRLVTEKHDVKIRVYAEDQYGNKIDITDNLASPVYVTCTKSKQQYYYDIRCKRCNEFIMPYNYYGPEKHSYCK
ncbi:MAG: hypothetical protein J6J44_14220 [Lachnospiraceae bacterium]|nr:hypothetical protein [Lachnospiraceae bacterium]